MPKKRCRAYRIFERVARPRFGAVPRHLNRDPPNAPQVERT
jgi:hypothetical protein